MDDEGSADDRLGSRERNLSIRDGNLNLAIRASDNVSQVPSVSHLILRSAMGLLLRVEMRPRRHAPIGGVTELMQMESVLPRSQP
ncbi:hypothetical protein Mapa_015227 [Marchantia paleacea]|nr:hypothetical protein Mapa_015227 [Marchantia paleacea]